MNTDNNPSQELDAPRPVEENTAALAGMKRAPAVAFQHVDFLPGPRVGSAVRAAAARADLVLCVSHAIARDLDLGIIVGDCGGRYDQVDVDRFRLTEAIVPGTTAPANHRIHVSSTCPMLCANSAISEFAAIPVKNIPDDVYVA